MYLEEAEVKEYSRKNGTKYYQIHLGTKSKFKKEEKVIVVDAEVFNDFIAKAKPEFIEEILETNKILTSEKESVEHDLQEEKTKVENLNSKLAVAKEEIFKLQEEKENLSTKLTEANDVLLTEKDKLVKEKETSKGLLASITKLTNEKKELEKENIFLKARGLFNRILNKQYKKEDVPEIVEAEVNSTSEE